MKIPQKNHKINSVSLIIDNVRSSENVGSFVRTSDALGVDTIYLVVYTPKPLDKFGRPDSKIAKTALGAEKTINHKSYKTIGPLIKKLKKDGFLILGLEISSNAIDYSTVLNKIKEPKDIALIVGMKLMVLVPKPCNTATILSKYLCVARKNH